MRYYIVNRVYNLIFTEGVSCIFGYPKYTHSVCSWRLTISAGRGGGLSSACQFQYNPQNLMRGKLLMKHTYDIQFFSFEVMILYGI